MRRLLRHLPASLAALALGLAATSCLAQAEISGVATAVDGDTLDMNRLRIRLYGIDAPEGVQTCTRGNGAVWPCGAEARTALARKLGGRRIVCEQKDIDSYRRVVAVCRLNGEDLNAWLAREGWAVAYREYGEDYVPAETTARTRRLNIWNGSFQDPAEFRRAQDAAPTTSTPPVRRPGCRIKGNISGGGDRIYHVPGGEFYERTQIDERRGERFFCTEQEARAAGWRRAR